MNSQDHHVKPAADSQVSILIEKLKARFRVKTDRELAAALHLGRSAISTWKMRGQVPEKYIQIANAEALHEFYGETPWKLWNDLERAGMELALLRMVRDNQDLLADYAEFLRKGQSLPVEIASNHGQATSDVASKMAELDDDDVRRALNVIVFDEFFRERRG